MAKFEDTLILKDKVSKTLETINKKMAGVDINFKKISANFSSLGNNFKKAGSKITATTAKIGATLLAGTAAIALNINKTREYADRIDDLSKKIGLSKKGFQEWDYIIKLNGANIESLQMGFKSLVNQSNKALVKNKAAVKNFKALGISLRDNNGHLKNQEQLFNEVVSALQRMPDGVKKAKLANDLFGRSGSELMPLLKENAGRIEDLRKEAYELGLVFSDKDIEAVNDFSDKMDSFGKLFAVVGAKIGMDLIPEVNRIIKIIQENMPEIQKTIKNLANILVYIVQFTVDLIEKFSKLSPAAQNIILAFITLLSLLGPLVTTLGSLLIAISSISSALTTLTAASTTAATSAGAAGAAASAAVAPFLLWAGAIMGVVAALSALGIALNHVKEMHKIKNMDSIRTDNLSNANLKKLSYEYNMTGKKNFTEKYGKNIAQSVQNYNKTNNTTNNSTNNSTTNNFYGNLSLSGNDTLNAILSGGQNVPLYAR